MKIHVLLIVAIALVALCSAGRMTTGDTDSEIVAEWVLFSYDVREAVEPVGDSFTAITTLDTSNLTLYLANAEKGLRKALAATLECRRSFERARVEYNTESVRIVCDDVASGLSRAADHIDDAISVLDEIGGQQYRLLTRGDELVAAMEKVGEEFTALSDALNDGASLAMVHDSARRLLGKGR